MKLVPFASSCGCVNRTSHPCGSSGNGVALFRPGGTAAPEASRYRLASNWWAILWQRFQTLVARNPDDSFPANVKRWQTARCPINFAGSKPNPGTGSPALAKRLLKSSQLVVSNDELTAWLIEAAVRYIGKPVSVPTLQSMAVLFPFSLVQSLAYIVSNSAHLELRSEGLSNQFVGLRSMF